MTTPDTAPAVPDYPTPIVGWRRMLVYRMNDGATFLASPVKRLTWPSPATVMRADCPHQRERQVSPHQHEHGPVPSRHCRCGLYAMTDPDRVTVRRDPDEVIVRVESWGRHRIAEHGVRAERMRITGVADVTCTAPDRELIAWRYGVPLVEWPGPHEPTDTDAVVGALVGVVSTFRRASYALGRALDLAPSVPRRRRDDHRSYHSVARARDGEHLHLAFDGTMRVVGPPYSRDAAAGTSNVIRTAFGLSPDGDCVASDCPLPARPESTHCGRHAHADDLEHPEGVNYADRTRADRRHDRRSTGRPRPRRARRGG